MLTRELMGLLALGILWVNAGLILSEAVKRLRNVLELRRLAKRALGRGELVEGVVKATQGGERFALRRVHQTGRALTTGRPHRILFNDGAQAFEVSGGTIETAGGLLEIAPAADRGEREVWLDPGRTAAAAACPSDRAFDEAYKEAATFKGHARTVEIEVRVGDRVWVLGRRDGDRLVPWPDRPLVVSTTDPIAWAGGRARLLCGFVVAALVGLVVTTGLALWPPHFGWVSTLGGALGLVYFLGIQPVGTAVRDAVRTPAQQPVGGVWARPDVGSSR